MVLKLLGIFGLVFGLIFLGMTVLLYDAGRNFGVAALVTIFYFTAGYKLLRMSARKTFS